jgi:hypothetical protein
MILQKAQLDNSKFKAAVRGASGSGKTWWATAVAIGLHKYIGSKKPIAFWDTERALAYVLPHFTHNGIEVLEHKSRAFKTAEDFFREAEAGCDIAIIDSMTHIWEELIQSFKERKHKEKLAVWDWGIIKPEFREGILNRIVNTPLHLIICGRISDIYEYIQVDGDKVLTTTGSKMSAEKNTEYEPSLTVELERFTMNEEELKDAARAQKGGAPNLKLVKKAARFSMTVIKDRANVLGGHYEFEPHQGEFIGPDNDIWLAVKPFCEALNMGAAHSPIDLSVKSTGIFESPDTSWQERERQKTILLEEIEAEMKSRFGQSKDDKTAGIALLKDVFGTASWTAIQGMELLKLRVGHDKIVPKPAPKVGMTADELKKALVEAEPVEREAGEDNLHIIRQLMGLHNKPLVLRDDLAAALNLSEYDLGADPANIRDYVKSSKATEWKVGIGKLITWLQEASK